MGSEISKTLQQNLEERANSEAGINIIKSCLEQIRDYSDFQRRKTIFLEFIKKVFPNIREVDMIAITENLSRWIETYAHKYKRLVDRPSTAGQHPFIYEINGKTRLEIIEPILDNEWEYIEELNKLYRQYVNIPR